MSKEQYVGMTEDLCPNACNEAGCVISGKPYCGHPSKGALHQAEMLNKDALARRSTAEALLMQAETDAKIAALEG